MQPETLLYRDLEHYLQHALVPLIEKHLRLELCDAIRIANDECVPMAVCMREMANRGEAC